jgi:hypothetical protein
MSKIEIIVHFLFKYLVSSWCSIEWPNTVIRVHDLDATPSFPSCMFLTFLGTFFLFIYVYTHTMSSYISKDYEFQNIKTTYNSECRMYHLLTSR